MKADRPEVWIPPGKGSPIRSCGWCHADDYATDMVSISAKTAHVGVWIMSSDNILS